MKTITLLTAAMLLLSGCSHSSVKSPCACKPQPVNIAAAISTQPDIAG